MNTYALSIICSDHSDMMYGFFGQVDGAASNTFGKLPLECLKCYGYITTAMNLPHFTKIGNAKITNSWRFGVIFNR